MKIQTILDKKTDTKRESARHSSPPVNRMLHLQRSVGNQFVNRLMEKNIENDKSKEGMGKIAPVVHDLSSMPEQADLAPGCPTLPSVDSVEQRPHNFSGLCVQTAPSTKEPSAPEPQKDEEPLGTVRDRETGARENIYASLITTGLWWFNGGTPTLGELYPVSAPVSVANFGKGNFTVKVTEGSDKVALDEGGTTLNRENLTSFTVKTLAPSSRDKDVTIEVNHLAPGAKDKTTKKLSFEVRAPHHLRLLGTDHLAKGPHGYESWTTLQVFDNFGKPMPYIDVNEDFTMGTVEKGVSSEWKYSLAARSKGNDVARGNAVFKDKYGAEVSAAPPKSMMPKPSNPGKPLGNTRVASFLHDWYVGSPRIGEGVHVSHHVGVLYSDHGEYTKFMSPTAAKSPRK